MESIVSGLFLEGVEATDTGSDNHADTVAVNLSGFGVFLEGSVLDGLTGGDQGILGIEVELAQFLAVKVVGGVIVLNLAGKLRFKQRGVEMRYGAGAANAVLGVFPRSLDIVAGVMAPMPVITTRFSSILNF